MTKVSYFQRYSQRENHATNNTLLVMRFFYQQSPRKLEAALSELVGEELEIGLAFEQQVKFAASTPDALISQRPLELFFETKRGGELDKEQLMRHIESIKGSDRLHSRKILFGLTRTPISEVDRNEIFGQALKESITFVGTTFSDIVRALGECCEPHETDLHDILNDYEEFLVSENLMQIGEVMTVFPCGTSLKENVRYRLYFEPPARPSKFRSRFIGLYHEKCVRYIGRIRTVVVGKPGVDAVDVQSTEVGNPTAGELKRISDAVHACSYYPVLEEEWIRYYIFDELEKTEFRKSSKGGIRRATDFKLADWLECSPSRVGYNTADVAQLLRGRHFE